jgi:eukaryotic-like serine/threonine-protein kinase
MPASFDHARWLRASRHLDRVLDLPPGDRDDCVATIRAEDPDIATDVEAMLAQHRQLSAEGFMESATPIAPVESSLAGVIVGAYTLMTPIGHGGMGSVWLARRSDGRYEVSVAVKLLNAALVGRGGEERFRREGTILARLAHPHIARLIDAGVSNTGQPFLVLELVEGQHIDAYCNDAGSSIEDRIRLFLDVQSAVAHAHANLIVHRDLKPSNVLVTSDGQVKLLDFSIAKLIEDEGASRLTREAASAMTPKYAAPEQITGAAITTATDVYALGVLLYELLSGQHPCGGPFGSHAEYTRAIVENEPLRLSAAAATGNSEAGAEHAAKRGTTPDRLQRRLRGDLDTIVAKALKKDPAERYGSVAEFADDLRRHVEHQPITARPDAVGYRAAKFMRRHWRSLVASAAAVLVLASLTGFYTVRLATERDRARLQAEKASKISELLTSVLISVDPYRTPGTDEPTVRNLLDAAAARISNELGDQPELQAEMFTVIGRTYERLGIYEKALPLLEQALGIGRRTVGSQHVRVAQSLNDLGVLQRELGNLAAAEPLLRESLATRRRLLGSVDKDVAVTLVELARVVKDRGHSAEAETLAVEALAIRQKVLGDEDRNTATSKNEVGLLLWERGDLDGAERLLRENVATSERLLGLDHPNVGASKGNLGNLLNAKGDAIGAEVLLRENVRVRRHVFGENHSEYAMSLPSLAGALESQGKLDEARELLEQAMRIAEPQLGAAHPRVITAGLDLARVRIARGEGAAIEGSLRRWLEARERLHPAGDWRIAQAQSLLAASLVAQRRYAEAEPLMRAADAGLKPVPGRQGRERDANRARLASLKR